MFFPPISYRIYKKRILAYHDENIEKANILILAIVFLCIWTLLVFYTIDSSLEIENKMTRIPLMMYFNKIIGVEWRNWLMQMEARAKINIGLCVGRKRNDGYHPIRSYFARLSLADKLDIKINASDLFSCSIVSDVPYLEPMHEDIMEKCARAFSRSTDIKFSMHINVEKHIPSKAGFGGGSSDGASVLLALNEFFSFPLSKIELLSLGADCGSDIPFFLFDCPFAYIKGRGEIVKPVDKPKELDYAMLFMPDEEISTKKAYQALDLLDYEFKYLPEAPLYHIQKDYFPNDFERVCSNRLLRTLEQIYKDKAFYSLSGSGSGCFVLSEAENLSFFESIAPKKPIRAKII